MKAFVSIILVAFTLTSFTSEAQFKKLGGALGGKKNLGDTGTSIGGLNIGTKSGAGDYSSLVESQGSLLQQYTVAKANEAEANSLIAETLGMKKEAAAYKATADKLSSGNVNSKNDVEKNTKKSDKANKKINEELDKNEELSEESKGLINKAMGKYGTSLAQSRILLKDTIPFWNEVKRIIVNSTPREKITAKKKLGDGMYVARRTPKHIRNLVATFNKLKAVSKSQNIEIPENATKEFDELDGQEIEDLEDLEEL